jgi:transposase
VASTGGKKIWGRKRHLLVDTQGLLLAVKVHSAGLVDRCGAPLLLQDQQGRFPRLCHLFADSGYTGPLIDWIKAHLGWQTEIVPKPKSQEQWILIAGKPVHLPKPKGGFQVQRHRWKVERTFGWKWVCSFCESSLQPNLHSQEMSFVLFLTLFDSRHERKSFEKASRCCFTSSSKRNSLKSAYLEA